MANIKSSIIIDTEDRTGRPLTVTYNCLSVLIEDGFLKVIARDGSLHAYNIDLISSYHIFTET